MRRRFRIWNSVRQAQSFGLARRIQRAAKLRPRHRAKTKSNKAAILSICLSACSVYLSIASFQKSIQNPSKILPNRRQNGPKSRSGGSLWLPCGVSSPQGACGSLPGRLWGSSWAALGASWASLGWLLGCLGRQAGASKGVLRAAWRHLGRNFIRKWSQVGIKLNKSKILC